MTTGRVSEEGKLHIRNRSAFQGALRELRGKEVFLELRRARATRSLAMNRYYWAVCIELVSNHTGYSPDEVHEIVKQMFLPKKLAVCDGNGELKGEFVIGGTTTKLNTLEFGEFIERFRQWAAEDLGVVIPDPDPDWLQHKEETASTGSSRHMAEGVPA